MELDRNTPLLPVPRGSPPSLPSLDRQLLFDSSQYNIPQTDPEHEDTTNKEDCEYHHICHLQKCIEGTKIVVDYEQVLRSLLPRVPMTAKGVFLSASCVVIVIKIARYQAENAYPSPV